MISSLKQAYLAMRHRRAVIKKLVARHDHEQRVEEERKAWAIAMIDAQRRADAQRGAPSQPTDEVT